MPDVQLTRALEYLRDHPGSSAKTIANALGTADDRFIFHVLDMAAYQGQCQRFRYGKGAWLWEVPGHEAP